MEEKKIYIKLDRNSEYPAFDVYNPGHVYSSEESAIAASLNQYNIQDPDELVVLKVKKLCHTFVFTTWKKWYTAEEFDQACSDYDNSPIEEEKYSIPDTEYGKLRHTGFSDCQYRGIFFFFFFVNYRRT